MRSVALRFLAGILFLGLLVAWGVVLWTEIDGGGSQANHEAFGYLTAVLFLLLFTAVIGALGRPVVGLVMGKDKRVSTSKLQILVWTYAIAFGLFSLIAMTWVGFDDGFDKILDPKFDFEDYLFLLGGPFTAAVAARYLVGAKVDEGELAKPDSEDSPSVGEAFANDEGNADLVDTQYLLFNLVALAYYFGAFFSDPAAGPPDIPTLLFSLTSAAAAVYVANKAIASNPPAITGLAPQRGKAGVDEIEVFGMNLLFPKESPPGTYHEFTVLVDGVGANVVSGSERHGSTGDDRFKVKLPAFPGLTQAKKVEVKALNFRGKETEPKQIELLP